ncbi:glycosyltransferase family 2 protein [Pseudooceanicola sp. HF7]|uniref:glycosyltransferase family 2 protein n=1 Tax=Pseudooceanicola sp. HF7 TaxID=2721560 RepID=UPI00142FB6B1|nr:glycosyltransferase family 2 protein [Pseudooceanicola sp. HF7]NIZ11260.1 glycosyltransferase family 2 protein [Pseudooceanicola sp. HF7]
MTPSVTIIIPTYNRAPILPQAIEAALGQSHPQTTVMVVDDGSQDQTGAVIARYADHPRFVGVSLAGNVGTAQAKNVGIALSTSEAITFHDSDDLPHRDKVMRQARVLGNETISAHPCLNWRLSGREPDTRIQVGGVLTHHELILPDGERVEIRRALSLVDDFFPNLQMAAGVPGDWTHVNSGLYHRSVFDRLGGFMDCIEEDREFRNRLIMAGEVLWVIPEILLTKIETPDSLTQLGATDYDSPRRIADRKRVWDAVGHWFATREVDPVPIDLSGIAIRSCSNPALCDRAVLSGMSALREQVA